jgi:hypothetical protein
MRTYRALLVPQPAHTYTLSHARTRTHTHTHRPPTLCQPALPRIMHILFSNVVHLSCYICLIHTHTSPFKGSLGFGYVSNCGRNTFSSVAAYVSTRQHTSAHVSTRQLRWEHLFVCCIWHRQTDRHRQAQKQTLL